MAQTQQERKAETRTRLLDAAADLFAEQGIDGVSVDAVAEAAGRTSGAVYAHFGSKQGLLLAVLDAWKQSVLTVLLAEVAVSDSPTGQLSAVWGNIGSVGGTPGDGWALLEHELWLRASRDPEVAGACAPGTPRACATAPPSSTGGRRRSGPGRWHPRQTAILVKALLTGLEMQRRIEPGLGPRRPRRPRAGGAGRARPPRRRRPPGTTTHRVHDRPRPRPSHPDHHHAPDHHTTPREGHRP